MRHSIWRMPSPGRWSDTFYYVFSTGLIVFCVVMKGWDMAM
ncbi:hypothetical protein P262_00481 [Cronobacter malonaticus]|uniref:Uncharacterized protein n=1 Tax=Cronobacter malonaticus TaxID=413503 RepID=V5TTY7_9ENTR|nr:hypothetical protein P262_00481 [Cronobacter malonaticus]